MEISKKLLNKIADKLMRPNEDLYKIAAQKIKKANFRTGKITMNMNKTFNIEK
jgi:hypothetical protein